MKNKKIVIFMSSLTGFLGLLLGISCDNMQLTRSIDWDEYTEMIEDSTKEDDKSGFSFELESDTLQEEIEEVYFQAKEWEEEDMGADL